MDFSLNYSCLTTAQRVRLKSAQHRLEHIDLSNVKIKSLYKSLRRETRLNLLAGEGAMRLLCRALFEDLDSDKKYVLPMVNEWECEYRHGMKIMELLNFRIKKYWLSNASEFIASIADAFEAAERKMDMLWSFVRQMEYENRTETSWQEHAKSNKSQQEVRGSRIQQIFGTWDELWKSLEDHGVPEGLAKLDVLIDRILRKHTKFDGYYKSDPTPRSPESNDSGFFSSASSGSSNSTRSESRPKHGASRENFTQSEKRSSPNGRSSSKQWNSSWDEPKPRQSSHNKSQHGNRSSFDTEEVDAEDLRTFFFSESYSDTDQSQKKSMPNVKKQEIEPGLKGYNKKWEALDPRSAAVPFPTTYHLASDIPSSKLIAGVEGESLQWRPDERIMANIQAFFLLDLNIRPKYWEEWGQIKMGFLRITPTEKIEKLKLQLKKERFRWHPDKLGGREDGKLRDNSMAKMVQLAVQNLYDACLQP